MKRYRFTGLTRRRRPILRSSPTSRPCLEVLEDRCLLSFSPAVSYPVGMGPEAVVTGDFNGDAKPDLAIRSAGFVYILAGNGDGTFGEAPSARYATWQSPLAAADFNGDGNADLATTGTVLLG